MNSGLATGFFFVLRLALWLRKEFFGDID